MTEPPDPYKVLQVDREAEDEVIQAAYRRLALKYHPDTAGPEASGRMASINEAWRLIGRPADRQAFDRLRAAAAPARSADTPGNSASTIRREGAKAAPTADSAGPPPGHASGSVLSFGRYAGWSLGEIARRDLEFIEWLDRVPIGRQYREEIDQLLRRAGRRSSPAVAARKGLFRRG
ncbi:MAG: J domain-containing protein [Chloroflexota bacterium]